MKFPPDGHPYFKPPYEQPDKEHPWVLWLILAMLAGVVFVGKGIPGILDHSGAFYLTCIGVLLVFVAVFLIGRYWR